MNAWLSAHLNSPEMFLVAGLIVILLIDLILPSGRRVVTFYLSELLLIFVGILLIKEWSMPMTSFFAGHYMFDNFAVGFKGLLVLLTFLIFAYAKQEAAFGEFLSEFYFLSLLSLLGAFVLVSALSLITLYLGLELLSLPLYALIALKRDSAHAVEAGMKYFVMGALASAFLLFGFSLFYGLSGSIYLPEIAVHMNAMMLTNPIFYLALSLVVIAIAFKLGVFPFHMWVPDVYQGASLSVVALLSSIAKLAAFALLVRVLFDALAPLHFAAQQLLLGLGMFSLIIGNVVALLQKNIKRLLGYSTVANMGIVFIALGLSSPVTSTFYLVTYAFMSVALLGILIVVLPNVENLSELKGLNKQHPWLALLILLTLLSFAGVPPLLGFTAKLLVVMALLHQGYLALAVLVILMSVIGAAYYLRIVKTVYFDVTDHDLRINVSGVGFTLASVNALALLGFGIFPSGLMLMIQHCFS
jgi:NADH-quinone oxidoreductase subunit N